MLPVGRFAVIRAGIARSRHQVNALATFEDGNGRFAS
jgi:hypothetical protein